MKTEKNHRTAGVMPLKNTLLCLLTALIWGFAFVAQSIGGEEIDAFAYTGLRFLMGALVLLPLVIRNRRAARRTEGDGIAMMPFRNAIAGGIPCGLALFAGSVLQQYGVEQVAVGKAGFLTALYIILVPCLSFLLTRRSKARVWIAAVVALAGLYFLCMQPGESLSIGIWEGVLLAGALMFAIQIMLVDHFLLRADALELSFVQFVTVGVLASGVALFRGVLVPDGVSAGAVAALLYSGILSAGVGYTLQVVGQKGADPAIASLLLSFEAPFSALAGFLILRQTLTAWELLGCGLMLAAVVLTQLPDRKRPAADGDTDPTGYP